MQIVADFLKQFLHPASTITMVVLLAIGVVLLYCRDGRWGRRWLTALGLSYWAMATPACASWLEWPLTRPFTPIRTAEQVQGARVIVVLSAGTFTFSNGAGMSITTQTEESAGRALEAARLHKLLGRATIIASGGRPRPAIQRKGEGEAIADSLVLDLGVPPEDIVLENDSMTTYEQAVRVRQLLGAKSSDRFLLVTSKEHMRRSMAVFEAQGLHPIPAVASIDYGFEPRWLSWVTQHLPDRHGLLASDAALHEYAGLLFYWSQGRLARPPR